MEAFSIALEAEKPVLRLLQRRLACSILRRFGKVIIIALYLSYRTAETII
jgi:hypothetical protein